MLENIQIVSTSQRERRVTVSFYSGCQELRTELYAAEVALGWGTGVRAHK